MLEFSASGSLVALMLKRRYVFNTTSSLIRRLRHCLLKMLSSISAIEPTAMGSVVKLHMAIRRGFKCFVERAELVSMEVVQHQTDHIGMRIGLVYQPAHLERSPRQCELGHFDVSPPALGFAEHEQIASAVSLVFESYRSIRPGYGPNGRPRILNQLFGCLIETDDRLVHGPRGTGQAHPPFWPRTPRSDLCTIPSSSTA